MAVEFLRGKRDVSSETILQDIIVFSPSWFPRLSLLVPSSFSSAPVFFRFTVLSSLQPSPSVLTRNFKSDIVKHDATQKTTFARFFTFTTLFLYVRAKEWGEISL